MSATALHLAIGVLFVGLSAASPSGAGKQFKSWPGRTVRIGNYVVSEPNAISFIVDDQAAFVVDPGGDYYAGLAAPDNSYHETKFDVGDAKVKFEWGKVGDAAVGRFSCPSPTLIHIKLNQPWPGFQTVFQTEPEGAFGTALAYHWKFRSSPVPTSVSANKLEFQIGPNRSVTFVAGIGPLPSMKSVASILDRARSRFLKNRPNSSGDWGDFVGAISDNLNNSRVYSSDDHRVAITVSRAWAPDVNDAPYFCWDSFFNGALDCLDDPKTARNTVRAILAWQAPDGMVPNFGHWKFDQGRASEDRSQPPVGALCVWKMQQRWPNRDFLAEVYPRLVAWHRWWMTARDGNHDGLLEWGSSKAGAQGARWETGWDDTPHFDGAHMVGSTLNADAVDLNSLYAMDCEYLALIAKALGRKRDAHTFQAEHERMTTLINKWLWNPKLGIYCSRLWNQDGSPGAFLTRLTPMNFYPLIAGIPSRDRADSMLRVMTDPKRFWGKWVLPTLPFDDPDYPQQNYWRGKVWAPVNFLVFQGLQRYAPESLANQFAARSVRLFMRNWEAKRVCGENYLSTTGEQSSDPHYTWGSLLCLIGIENICSIQADGSIRLNGTLKLHAELHNIPIAGKMYDIEVKPGETILTYQGKAALTAKNRVAVSRVSRPH